VTDGENITFDEGGPVPAAQFAFPNDETPALAGDIRVAQHEAVMRLMHRLIGGDHDPKRIGRRVLLLAAVLKICRQCDVAMALGVSKQAVSAGVDQIRQSFLGK
jgi:hypothetical protein